MGEPRLGPPSRDCTVVELDDRVSVHCPQTGEVQILDLTATRIWHLLDGTRTLEELLDELHATYDVGSKQLRKDVQQVLDQLLRAGALKREPGAG